MMPTMKHIATRMLVEVANVTQMALAEAYINGVEVPDWLLRSFFDTCMPTIFKYFPALLTNLEQSQMHMIDDMIEKLDIPDGDNILDFGCGWGCVLTRISEPLNAGISMARTIPKH
jgi:cyclopropane fatty-acyl-phospholipid synthase-like methyltransferase